MALTTYGELKASVASWLDRSNLVDRVPEFIALGEDELFSVLRIRQMVRRITATISTEYYPLPTDFIEAVNLQINTTPKLTHLKYYSPEQMDLFLSANYPGNPEYYTIVGDEFQFKPIFIQPEQVEIAYFARFPTLSGDNDSNWILQNQRGLYLYAALKQAEPYLDNNDEIGKWATLFNEKVSALNRQSEIGRFSGTTLQRQTRVVEGI